MSAYAFLAAKRQNRENHIQFSLLRLAQSEDEKAVKQQIETWERDT